ncbi:RNA-binding transcriptional accessory protein [Microbulbifer sp. OS29]|uniref:RNA-binding transcriptional accessory protein n=1 Tax=Microbulbifer okhotskensis TaxID=2926617 RepID=A0A9X2EPR9_9GAMM|nr:Tex family protein [Microbulbifer okhotskensis]MCO1335500.1 RNA-binding transcriptional accessory protein [Microbulbifer okhotskensis]
MLDINVRIAEELNVRPQQVTAAVSLLDEGATVPFISRYRKEVTGALDDTQLRTLEDRLRYLRELEERRATILKSIDEQDKLTPELAQQISAADTKNRLEDLYLPYKPKRRTKGQIAIEAGLLPLADALIGNPSLDPSVEAQAYLNTEHEDASLQVKDIKAALDGAKFILMERFAEDAELLGKLRGFLKRDGQVKSKLLDGKEEEGAKFRDYFEYAEDWSNVPSHRALAIFRGRNEGVLAISVGLAEEDGASPAVGHPCEAMIARHVDITDEGRPADKWLGEVVRWTWRIKLLTALETDLMGELREKAEEEAIKVFSRNLKDLLLAAPAGQKATIGLDPGLRTGVKVAVVDATGKLLDYTTIFPTPPQNRLQESAAVIAALCNKHNVGLIAIGNGTASRETDKFVGETLKQYKLSAQKVVVNEAGASIYSASEFAAREFPDLDVTIRGAISIARRLQDPLAELVKIEPKSIGVGQYQHDVSQTQLARSLDAVVEDCVNGVGAELNSASAPLLAKVSGLSASIASNIVNYRDQNGAFKSRKQLMDVPRLGPKAFEQAAGFLRINNGENPLDKSGVHPESYVVVKRIAEKSGREINGLIGDSAFLRRLNPSDYTDEKIGLPTVTDIIAELEKPGRDPRPEFRTARFEEGVEGIKDLRPAMVLEGTVTNVTNFGAFVDIGVHQDGLVHISALSEKFVKDPHEVVKAGDIVKVKVMEVDVARKRIGLTMRLSDEPGEQGSGGVKKGDQRENRQAQRYNKQQGNRPQKGGQGNSQGSMGDLLMAAMKNKK